MKLRLFLAFFLTTTLTMMAAGQKLADNSKPAAPDAANGNGSVAVNPLADARALMSKLKFAEAASSFRAILEKNPTSAEAHAGLVTSLLRAHNLDEAREAATKAVAAAPASALVHAVSGDVAFRDGRFADSENEYRAAVKLDANAARAQYGMGRMYLMVSMNKRAKEAFDRAHQLDPEDGEITEAWLRTLSYADWVAQMKKRTGDHPSEQERSEIEFLTAAAGKKPWTLAGEIKPTEIKMLRYGLSKAFSFTGHTEGVSNIYTGFGLNVRFNDKVSADLLLDTGASGIIVGRKLAERIGVKKIADDKFGGIGDQGFVSGYFGWVDKIKIGNIEFENCIVNVSSRTDIVDESGLIGANVFKDFLITLDFQNWKLLLNPLPHKPSATSEDDKWQDRYIAPEMQSFTKFYTFGHNIVVPVVVNDKALGNFILDTGAGLTTMNAQFAKQVTTATADDEFRIKGVSGKAANVLTGKKAILQIAKMRIEAHDIPVLSTDTMSSAVGTEIAGLIGIRVLVQMKMTIDYRDGLVNLQVYEFQKARE